MLTADAAILFFLECPKPIAFEVLVVSRPYQKTSGFQSMAFTINILHRVPCYLQTTLGAILVFVECPKSKASEGIKAKL